MSRPLRIEFPGAVYYFTSQGDARQPVFHNNSDRINFLTLFYLNTGRKKLRGKKIYSTHICYGYSLKENGKRESRYRG